MALYNWETAAWKFPCLDTTSWLVKQPCRREALEQKFNGCSGDAPRLDSRIGRRDGKCRRGFQAGRRKASKLVV